MRSGKGGDGAVSFRHERYAPRGGPDGGDGGKGGDVIIKANKNIDTLNFFIHHHHFFAENGENGKSGNKHGKNGKDMIIEVPVGTLVIDRSNGKILADLNEDGKSVVVAKGGKGGRGNKSFATAVERAPHYSEKGEPGVEKKLELRLKILSDVGIVGFPNAGKSTLLSKVTNAHPTIANYAFTTLSPKIGVVDLGEGKRFVMADLPGLIEGASEGKGMGNEFLAHIERAKVLLFLIDGTDKKSIFPTYNALLNELRKYKPELLQRDRVIAVNKIDTWKVKRVKEIRDKFTKLGEAVFFISAKTGEGIIDLLEYLYQLVKNANAPEIKEETPEEVISLKPADSDKFLRIEKVAEHVFRIHQKEIERYVSLTDFDRIGSVAELMRYFKRINLDKKLKQAGVKEGDKVIIGNQTFTYKEDE